MSEDKQTNHGDVTIDDNGMLIVKVNLRAPGNVKVLCYGILKLAEEEASRYFIIQELRKQKQAQALGLIKPDANGMKIN